VFQQLVELKESGRILNDLANGNQRRDHTFSEMREILESWRWEGRGFRQDLELDLDLGQKS
jgi:hypothetical protein